jgi:hypothetical protein
LGLTRSDDLGELLELLGADLDVADLEKTGEELKEEAGQLCSVTLRNQIALKDVLRTFASVSAFQTMGMVLKQEDVD